MEENTMRYNSSRNRITRSIGVLVGAALVAGLVLPSVAQAQTGLDTPGAPRVDYRPDKLVVTTAKGAPSADHDYWFYTLVTPSGRTVKRARMFTGTDSVELLYDLRGSTDHGAWKAKVQSATAETTKMVSGEAVALEENDRDAVEVVDEDGESTSPATYARVPEERGAHKSASSPNKLYTHGPPPAAKSFGYTPTSADSHVFTWVNAKGDSGILGYRLEWTDRDPTRTSTEWERAKDGEDIDFVSSAATGTYMLSADDLEEVDEGVEYTFRLMALGNSSSDRGDIGDDDKVEGLPADILVTLGAASTEGTPPPTPTPTLPEWAALFLALLLMGSGAYLLRGRQQGGLTL